MRRQLSGQDTRRGTTAGTRRRTWDATTTGTGAARTPLTGTGAARTPRGRRVRGLGVLLTLLAALIAVAASSGGHAPAAAQAAGAGRAYAWGDNYRGRLGNPSTTNSTTPAPVQLAVGVSARFVSAGAVHSLAVGSDGRVYAWGANEYGQLGIGRSGGYSTTPEPVQLPAGVSARSVSASGHSLAVDSDGYVYAWGDNSNGQLGIGRSGGYSTTPELVQLPAGVSARSVAAGYFHSLAVGSDGMLYAWGDNFGGELGIGRSGGYSTTPAPVVGLSESVRARAVFAGGHHGLALGRDGTLYTWGANESGQLGDGTTTNRSTPVSATLPAGVRVVSVAAGGRHTLALGADGALYAWGWNHDGQLGDGTTITRTARVSLALPMGTRAVAIAAGGRHSLALGATGALYAWGANESGELGDGTTMERTRPISVTLPPGVRFIALSAGLTHSLALGGDGRVYAWGDNGHGQLGDGSTVERTRPVAVTLPGGGRATAVFAGDRFSLALGADGRLYAWGANADGELGDGAATDRATPGAVRLPRGVRVSAAAAGDYYSLAVGSGGRLYAWGLNRFGQLGDGTRTTRRTPVAVTLPARAPAVAVAARGDFSVALGTGGEVYAWGSNRVGEVGDGTRAEQDSPVRVPLPLSGGTQLLSLSTP